MSVLIPPGEAICILNGQIKKVPKEKWYWQYKIDLAGKGRLLVFGINGVPLLPLNRWNLELKNTAQKLRYREYLLGLDETKIELKNIKVDPAKNNSNYPYRISLDLHYKPSQDESEWEFEHIILNQSHRISKDDLEESGIICPLLEDSGYYPTRIVVMAGDTHTGKSCFLYALRTQNVSFRLSNILNNGFFYDMNKAIHDVIPATHPSEIHHYAFYIQNSKKETTTIVYFVDLAGEIVRVNQKDKENKGTTNIEANIRESISGYASALIVVTNLKAFYRRQMPVAFLQQLTMLRRIPTHICYVQTEADLIQQLLNGKEDEIIRRLLNNSDDEDDLEFAQELMSDPDYKDQWRLGKNSEIFKNAADAYDPEEAIFRHISIANDVLSRQFFTLRISENVPCFFVSSCHEAVAPNQERQLNFKNAKNVELPIAYLVRQFVKL